MKGIFKYTSIVIGTVLFVIALNYVDFGGVTDIFRLEDGLSFLAYLLISVMIFSGFVFRWYMILKSLGANVNFRTIFNYRVAAFSISYLTPSARLGGEPLRTYFLVKDGVPVEKAMSSVFIDRSLEASADAIMAVLAAIILGFISVIPIGLRWLLILVFIIMLIVINTYYIRIKKGRPVFSYLIRFLKLNRIKFIRDNTYKVRDAELEMTSFLQNHKNVFIFSTLLSFILWGLSIFEFKYLLIAFGHSPSFLHLYLVLAVVGIVYLVPIPTALGILEGGQISLFRLFGKASFGLVVSFVTRIRDSMWALYGLVYIYIRGVVVENLLKDSNTKPEISERVKAFRKWKVK
ncbi:MAG: lysylphosphatidylglycerol synthase transmembrane domain-containing protein [Nanobdellota archaeon]